MKLILSSIALLAPTLLGFESSHAAPAARPTAEAVKKDLSSRAQRLFPRAKAQGGGVGGGEVVYLCAQTCELPVTVKVVVGSDPDCVYTIEPVVLVSKKTKQVKWIAKSADPAYEVQFVQPDPMNATRAFGIRIHDNHVPGKPADDVWRRTSVSTKEEILELTLDPPARPFKASAYSGYLEYRTVKSRGMFTACKTILDPIIINDGD